MKRLLMLLVAALLPLTACLENPQGPYGDPANPLVGGVGDSLTYHADRGASLQSSDHFLADQLVAAGYRASIGATIGASTRDLVNWRGWSEAPSTMFVALGTNDRHVIDGATAVPLEESIANVEGFLDRWAPACPVLTGLIESSAWGLDESAPAWNDYLQAEAVERGGIYVDWWAIASQHPEWYAAGDVHANVDGQTAYRDAIIAGVQACSA